MKRQKKYRVHLRIHFAIASIVTLCAACLFSCGVVVLGTVFLYHGEMTIPVVIALCLLVCTLTMVIGGIALYYETAYFVKPIEEVNHAVNRIAEGDFEVRVPRRKQHRKDAAYVHELDELKANVNRMGTELAGMDYPDPLRSILCKDHSFFLLISTSIEHIFILD